MPLPCVPPVSAKDEPVSRSRSATLRASKPGSRAGSLSRLSQSARLRSAAACSALSFAAPSCVLSSGPDPDPIRWSARLPPPARVNVNGALPAGTTLNSHRWPARAHPDINGWWPLMSSSSGPLSGILQNTDIQTGPVAGGRSGLAIEII